MKELREMSAGELQAIKQKIATEDRLRKEAMRKERDNYDTIRDAVVKNTFKKLETINQMLMSAKQEVFREFEAVMELKADLFDITPEKFDQQASHTFTTIDGQLSIIIGNNVIDRWDETVDVGLKKVNDWLSGLARDEASALLVEMIRDLLKPNKRGVLKASRILDLSKRASEIGDTELIEAVDLIRDAYRPSKSSTFVKAKRKGEIGQDVWLSLSMSGV